MQACTSRHIGEAFARTPDGLADRHVGLGGLALSLYFPYIISCSTSPFSFRLGHARKLAVAEMEKVQFINSSCEDLDVTRFIVGQAGAR